jgi:hypothetical protein
MRRGLTTPAPTANGVAFIETCPSQRADSSNFDVFIKCALAKSAVVKAKFMAAVNADVRRLLC